ncbi:MAG TPA: hypothetical protein VG274_00470, partial [Rhizomicrobium sp.]|nr:hypothetical protein [Rhizomicrobium sp.]
MSAATEKIAFLRASLAKVDGLEAHARVPLGHPAADACLRGGIQKGALHEIYPTAAGNEAAASGFAVALAVRVAAKKRVLWLRPDFAALEGGEISPLGLLELGFDPTRMLLLRAADAASALRAALDALSCKALGAIVIEIPGAPKILDLAASRRLVLACAQTGVTTFLLRLLAEPEASAAETRWLIGAARSHPPSGALARLPPPCGEVETCERCSREQISGGGLCLSMERQRPPPEKREGRFSTSPQGGGKVFVRTRSTSPGQPCASEGGKEEEDWGSPLFE